MNRRDAVRILVPAIDRVCALFRRYVGDEIEDATFFIDERADGGSRHLAYTTGSGRRVYLAPRLATFAPSVRLAIVAHEAGHVVDILRSGAPGTVRQAELRADRYAEQAVGRPLSYAPPLWLETFGHPRGAVRPRPRFLDRS